MNALVAPAKLTLRLAIVGVRADGLHLIDAEMSELELCDELVVTPDGDGITVDGPYADGVPTGPENLVARALALCSRRAAVHITKRIPHGGGLGGGSADAAAVLRWAGFSDLSAAATIGADVPFSLVGGRASVGGVGEIVVPIAPRREPITLVCPPLHVDTGAVYRTFDRLGDPGDARNHLEGAAIAVEPSLATWRERIERGCGTRPTLAGSGASWWLEGHHPALTDALPEAHVVFTHTVG